MEWNLIKFAKLQSETSQKFETFETSKSQYFYFFFFFFSKEIFRKFLFIFRLNYIYV